MGIYTPRAASCVRFGAALVVALAATACGDGESSSGPGSTTADSAPTVASSDTTTPSGPSVSSSQAHASPTTRVTSVETVPSTDPVACDGEPVVVGLIASLDGVGATPSVVGGAEAAALEANSTCSAGRPLTLVTCDDQGNPSLAAECGREIVNRGAIALVAGGFNGITTASYETIVQEAGIPSIGNFGSDPSEFMSPQSFPFYTGLSRIFARSAILRAAGASTVSLVLPDEPGVQALVPTFESTIQEAGLTVDRFVFVPLDATDLAQYASQAAGADGIMIFTETKATGILQALLSAGITPENKVIVAPVMSQDEIDQFEGQVDGLYMSAQTVPLSETTNEGIAAYLSEARAAGVTELSIEGVVAWRALHVVADAIGQLPAPDAASLTELMATYSFAPAESAPVDFGQPAFPDTPMLGQFRIFSREFAVWQIRDGRIGLAVPGFVDPADDFDLG